MHMCLKCILYDNTYVMCFIQNMLRDHSHRCDTQYTEVDCFSIYFITCHKIERLWVNNLQILAFCTKYKDERYLGSWNFIWFSVRMYNIYKSTKLKLPKTNAAIWYNKIWKTKQLSPYYIHIKVDWHNIQRNILIYCFYWVVILINLVTLAKYKVKTLWRWCRFYWNM